MSRLRRSQPTELLASFGQLTVDRQRAVDAFVGAALARTASPPCPRKARKRFSRIAAAALAEAKAADPDAPPPPPAETDAGLLEEYVELEAALIAPVCPHFAHHVWHAVLRKTDPVAWPDARPVDKKMTRSYGFLKGTARSLRLDAAKELKALKGKQPKGAYVYVAGTYPDWRKAVLEIARRACADASGLVEKKVLLQALKADPNFAKGSTFEKQAKLAMQFGSFMHDYASEVGIDAFDDVLPFSQVDVLNESKEYLSKCIFSGSILDIQIIDLDATPSPPGPEKKIGNASPGKVTMHLFAE